MNLDSTDDTRVQLRDSLARYLADHEGLAGLPLWRGLARELGLIGAALPESAGGLGGGFAEHLPILQTLGEAMAAEPYLSSAVIAAGLLQRAHTLQASALLPRLIDGDVLIAWAHDEPGLRDDPAAVATTLQREGAAWRLSGRKRAVQAGPVATHFIATARSAGRAGDAAGLDLVLVAADAPGITRRDLTALDGRAASELNFAQVPVPDEARLCAEGQAHAAITRTLDEAALAVCAEALGVMQRLQRDTIAHARERQQFGVPLASFQVLQHRIADMHIAREQAEALTWAVVDAIHAAPAERALAVSAAKVAVGRALRCVGQGAVQIHGAMGITEELAVGRLFRRATQIELMFGSTAQHLRRITRLQRSSVV